MIDAGLVTLGNDLVVSGALWGLLFLGNVAVLIILAMQIDAIARTCMRVVEQKRALAVAAERAQGEIYAAGVATLEIEARVPAKRTALGVLGMMAERLAPQVAEAKRARVREIILTDVFISPGDRPFIATVHMRAADPEAPTAEVWGEGREHIFYAPTLADAQERFARRFPAERGFTIDEPVPFEFYEMMAQAS